ncbi:MAG: hypothetical protein JO249_26365 [Acidobacteria bacterium]|nr:hypothetical protein [Acidobacteriota bacterium]
MLPLMIEAALRSLAVGVIAGLGLLAFRVRNVRLERAVWTTVLGAALLMPALMKWPVLRVPSLQMKSPAVLPLQTQTPIHIIQTAPKSDDGPRQQFGSQYDWQALATFVYLVGAGLLFARLLFGLYRAERIRRKATPVMESWTRGANVRVSSVLRMPVTIGSTILLPEDFDTWDTERLRAVIAHEQSHVLNGDSLVLFLASLHRAIFWMSPLSWWLQRRLTDLAEAISDEVALRDAPDRPSYAELLIDLARRRERVLSGLAMARPGTISRRVERILSGSRVSLSFAWQHRVLLLVCAIPVVVLAAGCSFMQSPVLAQPLPVMPLSLAVTAQETPTPPVSPGTPTIAPVPPAAPSAPGVAPVPPSGPLPPARPARNWWWSSSSDREPYVIVSGDSLTMSGSSEDAERARRFRNGTSGDYIWFVRDGTPYMISDPKVVQRAKDLFKPQERLGHLQEELGKQQAALGEQQARLAGLQAQVKVHAPSSETLDRLEQELQQLRAKVKASNGELSQNELSELQSRIADLQSAFGEAQSVAGEKQAALGEQQSKLGEEQSRLGEQQSRLGEEQSRLGEEASKKMQALLDESIHSGAAHRVQ